MACQPLAESSISIDLEMEQLSFFSQFFFFFFSSFCKISTLLGEREGGSFVASEKQSKGSCGRELQPAVAQLFELSLGQLVEVSPAFLAACLCATELE